MVVCTFLPLSTFCLDSTLLICRFPVSSTRGVGDVLGPAASLENDGVALEWEFVLEGFGVGNSSSSWSASAFEGLLKNETMDDCFCNVGVFATGVLFEADEGVALGFFAD